MKTEKPQKATIKATPITITKETMDIILKQPVDNISDCISVYMFLVYTSNWQHNNQAFCTNSYIAKGIKITVKRVIKANKVLKELGLIEHIKKALGKGKGSENYVKVNYQLSSHNLELIDGDSIDSVNLDSVYNDTQIPLTGNKIPDTDIEIPVTINTSFPINILNGSSQTSLLAYTSYNTTEILEENIKAEDNNIISTENGISDTPTAFISIISEIGTVYIENNISMSTESDSFNSSGKCKVSRQVDLDERLQKVLLDPWYINEMSKLNRRTNYERY